MMLLPCALLFAWPLWVSASDTPQPRTITLTQRLTVRHARHIPRSLLSSSTQAVSEPLQDQFNGTDLQWFGEVGFGSPPQMFGVVFDTGSFDVEIPGIQCGQSCANQRRFDFTKSSTFVNTSKTNTLIFDTGGGVEPSDFESLQVLQVVDTMTLLGISVPKTSFFLITNQTTGFLDDPYDGIIGLGFQPNTGLFAALKQNGLPALFSMSLTPHTIGNAELTIGGIDNSKLNGSEPVWAPILPPTNQPNFWSLNTTQLTVNGQAVKQDLVVGPMVFDSGTSNIVMHSNLTTAMYALISPAIKPFGTLGAFGIACSEISSLPAEITFTFVSSSGAPFAFGIACSEISSLPAEITFTFVSSSGAPFNLTIPSKELNVGPLKEDPNTCQTLINALDQEGGGIIGGSLLKYYYSVWDVDNARLGFVGNGICNGTGCATHGSNAAAKDVFNLYLLLCCITFLPFFIL